MKQRLFSHVRGRYRVLVLIGVVAVIAASSRRSPAADNSVDGLRRLLERASGQAVDPDQLAWEPSGTVLGDLLIGRGLFFLAATKPGAPRDVFHAFIRIAPDGRPLSVTRLHDITETPLGDDTGLSSTGHYVAFATTAFAGVQAVTVLDVDGIGRKSLPDNWFDRSLLAINLWQEQGSLRGFGRTDILFDAPPKRVDLKLDAKELSIDLAEKKRSLSFDLTTGTLYGRGRKEPAAAHAVTVEHGHKPFIVWAVDTVRYEVGPQPIAWLEETVFGVKDTLKRTTYSLFAPRQTVRPKPPTEIPEDKPTVAVVEKHPMLEQTWPPPPIRSIWSTPKAGEGEWEPVTLPWLSPFPVSGVGEKPPPYFYKTVIRPDPERAYAEVTLIACDMRQLELRMEAGVEDPKPLTGPPGVGHLPRDPKVLSRVVATFNGAFKTTHGAYGMMVDRRVLLPPVSKAASVVVDDNGDAGFGTWPVSTEIPHNLVSYRQNLDPLIDGGVVNPAGRNKWGAVLGGNTALTERTAICLAPSGQIYYAWGHELTGRTLSQALQQAGCDYAIHLDMNPKHCGFAFASVRDVENNDMRFERADHDMDFNPLRYAVWSPKDFFYLLIKDPAPAAKMGEAWSPSPGVQPEPAWLPGLFATKVPLGSVEVELSSIERGRVDWRMSVGSHEPGLEAARSDKRSLSPADSDRALLALSLGYATAGSDYGLSLEGDSLLALRAAYGTLVLPESGAPRAYPASFEPVVAANDSAVQLPVLAQDKVLTPMARERGARVSRGAMCVLPGGRVLVARAEHDSSDVMAEVLVEQGCDLVFALDRGSHQPLIEQRKDANWQPPHAAEATVLYALNRPMESHAYHWRPEVANDGTKQTFGPELPRSR